MQLERIVVVVRLVAARQDPCQRRTSALPSFAPSSSERSACGAFQVVEDRHRGFRLPCLEQREYLLLKSCPPVQVIEHQESLEARDSWC